MIVLPSVFVTRMKGLLGEEYSDFEKSLNEAPVRAFRVNTDKISVEEFEKINIFGNSKVPYTNNGFYLEYDKIGNHPYHKAGLIYVQEPAAMAPAESIDVCPDWYILDMCAAPGGKSTQLKNKLGDNGVLVSNEIVPSRCKILTGNIERLGLHNTVTTCMDTSTLAEIFPHTFDMVMCDAPCSGEGMFRKEQAAIDDWSIGNVTACAKRQGEILSNAARLVKHGGYIVYSTCTFSLEENEMTVDAFLLRHPEFELCEATNRVKKCSVDGINFDGCVCKNLHFTRRFYPHIQKGEGQFVAVLKNTLSARENVVPAHKINCTENCVFEFLDDTLEYYSKEKVLSKNGTPIYFTDFDIKNATAFSCGITIGEIRKGYILPHHQFFSALGGQFKRKINLSADSTDLQKYLRGEEISTALPNGWAAVTVDGYALGGAKVVNGVAKNHYPKGLRIV